MSSSSSSSGSYDLSRFDPDREMKRLRTQTLLTWRKEARQLTWYGLRDGMAVLELGSGPGFVTEQLLDLVPHGTITTVERDPAMIERAAGYLRGKGEGRLRSLQGSVMAMDLPDACMDFALARFLFEHLPDPVGAAREILRVLKPGGTLALVDVDDGFAGLYEPERPELEQLIMRAAYEMQRADGGNRHIGRFFLRILREAGYQQRDLDLVVWHSGFLDDDDARRMITDLFADDDLTPLVKAGYLTEQQLAELHAADERWLADPALLMLYPLFMARGSRP
jgi:ubiquinone/menaquinone biosynthesis C-methylase UbiE